MAKEIRVLLVDDDLNARDMMALILRSDWRIEIAGKTSSTEIQAAQIRAAQPHLILIGGESYEQIVSTTGLFPLVYDLCPTPRIICAVITPPRHFGSLYLNPLLAGCLVKDEIGYSLPWAVALAARGERVVTPGGKALFPKYSKTIGNPPIVLDGSGSLPGLTAAETDLLRIALLTRLYNQNKKHLEGYRGLTNPPKTLRVFLQKLEEKMELQSGLENEFEPGGYFAGKEDFWEYFQENVKMLWGKLRTAQRKELLSYYLCTLPKVQKNF